MSLSDTEKAQLVEIIRVPYPELVAAELALILGTAQETILKADLARYQVVRGSYGTLNGTGKSGVEFDYADERAAIRKRIITLLDCADTVRRYANAVGTMIYRG